MQDRFKSKTIRWVVVGGLLLLMSLTSVGFVQAAVNLSEMEKKWLTYIREEEKLARDVYIFLYAKWNLPIFDKISQSEQTHMDAIKTLLDRYRLPDPAQEAEGMFTNPTLQTLYTTLIGKGSISLIAALDVGVEIEVTDIKDLSEGIATTERKDIITVYSNLLKGSANHLESFNSHLETYRVAP